MLKKFISCAALICSANAASAAVIEQQFIISEQDTDFTETITFDLFDDLDGARQLESVTFSMIGSVQGDAFVENLNPDATEISAVLVAGINLIGFDDEVILTAFPNESRTDIVAGYDGETDFAGASGAQFLDMNASVFETATYTNPASLMDFIGTGVMTSIVNFQAQAMSFVEGGGNLVSMFETVAGGELTITYTFDDTLDPVVAVTSPSAIALLGLGIFGIAGLRKFKS